MIDIARMAQLNITQPLEQKVSAVPKATESSVAADSSSEKDVSSSPESFSQSLKKASDKPSVKQSSSKGPIDKDPVRQEEIDKEDPINSNLYAAVGYTPQKVQQQSVKKPGEFSQKSAPVIKFMSAMEKEFGIKPEQIVEAMTKLNPEQLKSPAKDTKTAFLMQLGLDGAKLKRAEFLYETMLTDMAQQDMVATIAESNKNLSAEILTPEQLRQRETLQSVNTMSDKFFVKGSEGPAPASLQHSSPLSQTSDLVNRLETLNEPKPVSKEFFVKPQSQAAPTTAALATTTEPQTQQVLGTLKTQAAVTPAATSAPVMSMDPSGNPLLKAVNAQSGGVTVKSASVTSATPASVTGVPTDNPLAIGGTAKATAHENSKEEKSDLKDDSQTAQFLGKENTVAKSHFPEIIAAQAVVDPTSPEAAVNVRQVIQGAQILIRNGGGEMKVQMHPEGLGQVDLKVRVKDGQVEIQMLTDNSETKKLLEKGLGDLKAGLAQQKLNVETVKVEMSHNFEKDFSQSQQDLSRERARDFMNQFRDDRESWRQSMFEVPGIKSYRTQSAKNITPDLPSITNQKNRDRRLNLVA